MASRPGPLLFEKRFDQVQSLFAVAIITQILLIPCGLAGIKFFGLDPETAPAHRSGWRCLVFSVVGSYALRNSLFDVYVMFAFGLMGFLLESWKVPLAPMILGLILGRLWRKNPPVGGLSKS
jgi:putative tricarboxylic transport membrane protein